MSVVVEGYQGRFREISANEWPGFEDGEFNDDPGYLRCGSSREHAVWGLLQLGIRAIIGTTFAGIFNDNAANNGLLLISLEPEDIGTLSTLATDPARNRLTIDLPAQSVSAADGIRFAFDISPLRKDALVRGLDAIGTTLDQAGMIRAFEARHHATQPWLLPHAR